MSRTSYANVMATIAVFLAIGGGAVAVGAGAGDAQDQRTIDVCYKKRGPDRGDMRLLLSGRCTRQERLISFNQEGPQGVAGGTGPAGPQGLQGENGAQGAAGSPDTPQQVREKLSQVDGSSSGLDADLLDGLDASSFLQPGTAATGDLAGSIFSNPLIAPNAVALTTDTTGNYVGSISTTNGLTGGGAGEGAAVTLGLDYSSGVASNPALAAERAQFADNGLIFEGDTPDAAELLLTTSGSITADVTLTVPNSLSGFSPTVAVASGATAPSESTTPLVAGVNVLRLNQAVATEITNLVGGVDGQVVTLIAESGQTIISDGGRFRLAGAWTPGATDDTLTLVRSPTAVWVEVARSVNGQDLR